MCWSAVFDPLVLLEAEERAAVGRELDLQGAGGGDLLLVPDVVDGVRRVGEVEDHPWQVGFGGRVGEVEDGDVGLGICAAGAGDPIALRVGVARGGVGGQFAGMAFNGGLV